MAMTRNTLVGLSQGSFALTRPVNTLGTEYDETYDAFTAEHSAAGAHTGGDLHPAARGLVILDGTTATLTEDDGVTSVNRTGLGVYVITLASAAASTDGIHISVSPVGTDVGYVHLCTITSTVSIIVRIADPASTIVDVSFSFTVWVD